jgi:hypothetical protein
LLLAALPAQADLYRWVDPQSGSVKFSNLPPPWYGDPLKQARSPAVEVIPNQAPGKPPAAVADKPVAPRALSSLEERWRALLQVFTALPKEADFDRAGEGIQQQVQAYEAVRAELDRMDPSGAARRRAQEGGTFERLKKGLGAQFGR